MRRLRRANRHEEAVALVITLSLLVVMTIVVLGFLVSMRTERQAAVAMSNGKRAESIAQNAVEHAMAILDNNIPQPVPPGTAGTPQNWIVSPGLLTKMAGADGSQPTYLPLSTNADYNTPPSSNYVNLNKKSAVTGNYPIIPTGEELRATWINVLQDPTATASATNPIVGRYAFWMDDENAKINVNTAYGKPTNMRLLRTNPVDRTAVTDARYDNVGFDALQVSDPSAATSGNLYLNLYPNDGTHMASGTVANAVGTSKTNASNGQELAARLYPLWHPSAINLDVLGNGLDRVSLADWIFNGTWNSSAGCVPNTGTGRYRPLAYPEQIMEFVSASNPNFYQTNKFNLTTYNRAPEFNAFGKPRLLQETRIRTRAASPTTQDSMDTSAASGAELEFYQTPDLDPLGPSYFHGTDNERPNSSSQYTDLTSVQMVGDYVSSLLAKNNWPGMPARSFVDKWGGDDAALREADQVAWNIVALGNYSTGLENYGTNNPAEWPDSHALMFMRTTQVATKDSAGNISPNIPLVSQLPTSNQYFDPDYCLRYGALSHKAIMPFTAKPYLNEVTLLVTAVPVDVVKFPGVFNIELEMKTELYVPKRFAPGTFWQHFNLCFNLTHFYYTVTDSAGHSTSQAADGYSPGYGDGGASDGYSGGDHSNNAGGSGGTAHQAAYINYLAGQVPSTNGTVVLPADSYLVTQSNQPTTKTDANGNKTIANYGAGIWVSSGAAMRSPPWQVGSNGLPVIVPNPSDTLSVRFQNIVHVQAKARLFLYANTVYRTYEIVPVWDNADCSLPALKPPAGQQDSIAWDFYLDFSSLPLAGGQFSRSLEIADSRLGGMTNAKDGHVIWQPHPNTAFTSYFVAPDADTLGGINTVSSQLDLDSYSYPDFQNAFYPNSPRPTIGFLSCVPTGMQRGLINQTFTFGPSANKNDVPDWLILDLMAPAFADILQPAPAPLSYLHSTMGKLNINAMIYPGNPVKRSLPLQALFKNMVPDGSLTQLTDNIIQHNLSGVDFGAQKQYDYIGELCEVAGVADGTIPLNGVSTTGTLTNWQKEVLIRNLANLLTTQSNTFKVYGMAQAVRVKKATGNTNYGAVENGDTVVVDGERRFESVIERSVWPGADGVPGNAHVNTSGTYDQLAVATQPAVATLPWAGIPIAKSSPPSPIPTWAQFDGPDDPRGLRNPAPLPGWYTLSYTKTPLKSAVNPIRAHMTYKPITFRYVTD